MGEMQIELLTMTITQIKVNVKAIVTNHIFYQ